MPVQTATSFPEELMQAYGALLETTQRRTHLKSQLRELEAELQAQQKRWDKLVVKASAEILGEMERADRPSHPVEAGELKDQIEAAREDYNATKRAY